MLPTSFSQNPASRKGSDRFIHSEVSRKNILYDIWMGVGVELRICFTEQSLGSFKTNFRNSPTGITYTIFTVLCRWPRGLDMPHVTNRKGNSIKQGHPPMPHSPVASAPDETIHSSSRSQPSKIDVSLLPTGYQWSLPSFLIEL